MNVVRFPVVQLERVERAPLSIVADERLTVVGRALARVDSLVSIYRQVGARPNPATILMMIASILDDPELRKAAGIDLPGDSKPQADPVVFDH
jgi:hypothetical protein